MSAIIQLHEHQNTEAWRSYRSRRGNASEAAALMGCSPWFPRTPHELWLVKTGRASVEVSYAMRRGLELERAARRHVEELFDEVFEPQVVGRDRLSASLDGLSFDGEWVLEIKCPLSGRDSETWKHVEATSGPPEHYWWQVQQQLYCTGARGARFVVCHAEDGVITQALSCEVVPDLPAQQALLAAWSDFLTHMDADTPPPLGERDVVVRHDREWRDAVAQWKEARYWLEEARQAEAAARKALVSLAGDYSTAGAGVKLTRYWQKGEIDWRRATAGMDLEPYRKPGGWRHRVSEQE